MQNTLLSVQSESQSVDIIEQMEASLESLQKLRHVKISGTLDNRKIEVTDLGHATFKGLVLHDDAETVNCKIAVYVKNSSRHV